MRKIPEDYWALFNVARERVQSLFVAEIRAGAFNPLFGKSEPAKPPKVPSASANQRYWIQWLREFSEISSSVNRLNQSLVYLTHFPSRKEFRFCGLSEADWLSYHMEAYLQEAYILRCRLIRFLRIVEKMATAHCDKQAIELAHGLKVMVDRSFASIVKVRGSHVHERRSIDTELTKLGWLVLLGKARQVRNLKPYRQWRHLEYVTILGKWRRQLRQNNAEILRLCVHLFETAREILTRNEPVSAED